MRRFLTIIIMSMMVLTWSSAILAQDKAAAPAAGPAKEEAPAPKPAPPPPPPRANKVGDTVPAWEVQVTGTDQVMNSNKLSGKPYALVFVNSSCSACRGEMNDLLSYTFDRMEVLIVSVDFKPEKSVAVYKEQLNLPWPIVNDPKQTLMQIFQMYYTPGTVIVDKSGKVEFIQGGYSVNNKDEYAAAFEKYGDKKK